MATLLLDIAKGALPVWLVPHSGLGAAFPGGAAWCAIAVGFAAVAGHVWTFLAGFKGGKGVATTVGVLLALSPPAFGVFMAVFVVTLLVTRYVSLGSILGSLAFTAALARFSAGGVRSPAFLLGTLLAALVVVRHRENIGRLVRGQEHRFSFSRGKARASSRSSARDRGARRWPWCSRTRGTTSGCGATIARSWTSWTACGRTASFYLAFLYRQALRSSRNWRKQSRGPSFTCTSCPRRSCATWRGRIASGL